MNYEELVKALRWCDADFMHECDNCLYVKYKHCKDDCMDRMLRDAAAAIEDLQADQKKTVTQIFGEEQMAWEGRCKDLMYQIADLQAQLPKRGKWINHKDEHQCSACRETVVVDEIRWEQIGAYDYCPNCGAKMEVQE